MTNFDVDEVTSSKRAYAVRLGAQEINRRALVKILDERRDALGMTPTVVHPER